MPVSTRRIGDKWRVVEAKSGKIAVNSAGTPVDGGGHKSKSQAIRQVGAINTPKESKRSATR